jgi:pyruvate dehydrogenase E1 component alpha subunit
MSPDELIAFEEDIAATYETGVIRAPIHLSGGNEPQLIEVFKDFRPGDYVFSNWRSHYHALLAGVPPEKVKAAIMAGKSMTLCWPEHRFFSSAIFAGCLPIALGVAWQIKRTEGKERVFIFIGDMCALSGLARECLQYANGHNLPLETVVENNGISVCTKTADAWGNIEWDKKIITGYNYDLGWPHSGSGKRINF